MKPRRPNILITIADDQRGTALGCGGTEPVLTPALDRLAARGARFRQAQHLGSCHGAICAPSRAMLHTGIPYFRLESHLLGATYPPKDCEISHPVTLGEKLGHAGYQTFGTGKWHNGVHSFHKSFGGGANIFFGGMDDHWFTPVHDFDPSGEYPAQAARIGEGFSTELFGKAAIDFIHSRHDDDQPFFCYCAFTAPHDPRTPPDEWRKRYQPSKIALPPNIDPKYFKAYPSAPMGVVPDFDTGTFNQRDELLLGTPRDAKEIQRALAEYYGMISHMDEWIGRIHQAIQEIGQFENTIVIHTADHGLGVGQHALLGKQNLYQHSASVPLILAGPGIPEGLVSDALCYQHDLHPTLMETAGAVTDEGPFRSLWMGMNEKDVGRDHIGCAFQKTHRSIRNASHKLIEYNINGKRSSQLFDLTNDPWETIDLISEPKYGEMIQSLRAALRRWQGEVGDSEWTSGE